MLFILELTLIKLFRRLRLPYEQTLVNRVHLSCFRLIIWFHPFVSYDFCLVMVLAPILLRFNWGDYEKFDGTRPQIEHFLFETKRFLSKVSNSAKRDDFLMSIWKRRNLTVCVFFVFGMHPLHGEGWVLSFRFLPFCHENAFWKPRDPNFVRSGFVDVHVEVQ